MEVTLSQPRTYLKIQLNSEEITKKKQLNKSKRKPQNLYTQKNQLQHNLPTPAQQKTRSAGQTDPQITSWWETPTKERPNNNQKPKTHRANINYSTRSVRSGDQGDCTTESHRYSTTEVYTINPGSQKRSIKNQRLTRRVSQIMARQRNNPQMIGKGEL